MKAEGPRVRIEELRLRGFRAFENARLTLDDLTVLVGRNGAGKSTILDAFDFMREALSDSLENAVERRGGIQALFHKGPRAARSISIALKLRVWSHEGSARSREHAFLYGFTLQSASNTAGDLVAREAFISTMDGSRRPEPLQFHGNRTRDFLVLPLWGPSDPAGSLLLDALRTSIRTYSLHPAAIRAEPEIGRAIPLSRNGGNAGDVLKRLEKDKESLVWIVKHLAAITPGIVDIKPGTAAGRRIVQFLQSTGRKKNRFEIADMSDGTLRSLAMLLALRQEPAPALVCIDEIEDSVHPSALAVLLDAVQASTERCQVLLTSHSPEALSHPAVTAGRVRVVEWRDGKSEIFRLSKGAEEIARPPGSVGELLRTNALFTEEEPERVEGDFFEGG